MLRRTGRVALLTTALAGAFPASSPTVDANPPRMGEKISRTADPAVFDVEFRAPASAAKGHSPTRYCRSGARWMRPNFHALRLRGADRLALVSNGGDRIVLTGAHSERRGFDTRALRGDCVELRPEFADDASGFALAGYQYGKRDLVATAFVVVAVGDLCDSGGICASTATTAQSIAPNAVALLGDNAYDNGSLSEYQIRYDPAWGRFNAIAFPSPGNHEYGTSGAAGYFDYFNGIGAQNGRAGERGKGYYSWNLGEWHFVALNSNFASGSSADLAQLAWLRADLAANTRPCTAAYFHHPLVSVGVHHGTASMRTYWQALYAAQADLILVGHDHNYQRYAKMTPWESISLDGIRQVVVGTGGRGLYPISRTHRALEMANANSHGVLKLSLTANSYEAVFSPTAGSAFSDRFAGRCHRAAIVDTIRIADCSLSPLPATTQAPVAAASAPVPSTRRGRERRR